MGVPDSTIVDALRRMKLVGADVTPPMRPLAGGVSSDIWLVELATGPVCVKRALPRLKVEAVWTVPVERNRHEWEWLQTAARVLPTSVPPLIDRDPTAGCFVMGLLDPDTHPLWKLSLKAGRVDAGTARAVGHRLATLHAAAAGDAGLRQQFATDAIFHAIRLEPYLLATATRHSAVAGTLTDLATRTAATRLTLIHGDVSPKNILVGPDGPIFLDAECAWYGDPAFDVAFCLTHLLLKCLWTPRSADALLDAFDALSSAYLAVARWEPRSGLEHRAATLLPGLLLARVDGKSPVEYLTPPQQARVRQTAMELLETPPMTLRGVRRAWQTALRAAEPHPHDD